MKKGLLFSVFLMIILFSFSCSAQEDDKLKIDKAYDCLKDNVETRCSELSFEEKIFTLLSIGRCRKELLDDSNNQECWPKEKCNIEATAKALFALSRLGESTQKIENWILSKNSTYPNFKWYLEIESSADAVCSVKYSNSTYEVKINEDKSLDSSAGSCLKIAEENNGWLEISSVCYGEEFEISCDKSFLTTLLYKENESLTVHIPEQINSASPEGRTREKIDVFCFSMTNVCDYSGTLWASMALSQGGQDITGYTSYLISGISQNKELIPESFLYLLTGNIDFKNSLLLKQKESKYWDESGDKFYDTALALYAFQYEDINEKSNSMDWLLEIQDSDGCWRGNVRDTGFILYSLWPKRSVFGGTSTLDCTESEFYCMSEIDCDGNVLYDYSCAGAFMCCDTPKTLDTCVDQGGDVCSSSEVCDGTTNDALGLETGETCCIDGTCGDVYESSECELAGGECRSFGCDEGKEEADYTCDSGVCCVLKTSNGINYWWIGVLVALILFVVLGIIFRDKLRPYWFRLISIIKKKPKPGVPALGRPNLSMIPRRSVPSPIKRNFSSQTPKRKVVSKTPKTPRKKTSKKIIPQMQKRIIPQRRVFPKLPQRSKEVEEILKKLREIGEK
jgi:hypothetical protein